MSAERAISRGAFRGSLPTLWQGVRWAFQRGDGGGGVSRPHLVCRAIVATLLHGNALRRWMAMVYELRLREAIDDMEGEYLRAVRPYVNRHTDVSTRAIQLIDHMDWLETAFQPAALDLLGTGGAVVIAELPAPRGYDFLRLQLRRAGVQSPEGELLLTLTLQRSPEVQRKAAPVDAAALGFSRIRLDGSACLAIGGVRGQRHKVHRVSPVEISQALQGWKASVLLVRVMQELARLWGLPLVALDPAAHPLRGWGYRFSKRNRATAERIDASYDALWTHFGATPGPAGWRRLPQHSDDALAATDLSPEKRERQMLRADYWMRARKLLLTQLRLVLLRPVREDAGVTIAETQAPDDSDGWSDGDTHVPSRVLDTGPGSLM